MRVLICDDEPDVQLLLRLNVEFLGHTSHAVGRAMDAVKACEGEQPDVLLLDVSMPVMDGPSLLRELRARGIEPRHTMLVSAIQPADLRDLADELGVGWMSKPFTAEQIRMALAPMAEAA